MDAVLLISHGSRSAKTREEVEMLVEVLRRRSAVAIIEYAFLEIEPPDIITGLDHCAAQGAKDVLVLCNFLNSGRHVSDDVPALIAQARRRHPEVTFRMSMPIGQHPKIAGLFIDLMEHA